MSKPEKPREWWVIVDGVNGGIRGAVDKRPSGISGGGSNQSIRVIEHAAYQKAVAALREISPQVVADRAGIARRTLRELGELNE